MTKTTPLWILMGLLTMGQQECPPSTEVPGDSDLDGDGFDAPADCDDADPLINPAAPELCDGIDNDCDGLADDGLDLDGDGHLSCDGDCDDSDPRVHPDAVDVLGNNVDDDCDGERDEAVIAIASGARHVLALKSTGEAFGWGYSWRGQVGNCRASSQTATPMQVETLHDISSIAAGYNHSLAVDGGRAFAWGEGAQGELGNNAGADSCKPVQVKNLENVIQVAGGEGFSMALTIDGRVHTWGANWDGRLGRPTDDVDYNPNQGTVNLPTAQAIGAGMKHGAALLLDGTLCTWGNNERGQLGDGTTVSKGAPVCLDDMGLPPFVSITVDSAGTWAMDRGGVVWSIGLSNAPVSTQPNISTYSPGGAVSGVVLSNGVAWLGGGNTRGELCNGTTTGTSATQVLKSGVVQTNSDSYYANHLLLDDGTVWSCGENYWGQLGAGAPSGQVGLPNPYPVKALNLP